MAGTIQSPRYTNDREINRYVSIESSCCTDTNDVDSPPPLYKEMTIIESSESTISHLSKSLKHIEFDLKLLNYVELKLCE